MAIIYSKTTKIVKQIVPFFLVAFVLVSCQKEEDYLPKNVTTEIPEIAYVGTSISMTCSSSDASDIHWQISDGSSYKGTAIQHTFKNSGYYTIDLLVYSGNQLISKSSKEIYVLYKDKIYTTQNFKAIRSIYANDKSIILEGLIQKTESVSQSAFLILDARLNIIDTLYSYQEILNRINNVVQIGNSVYAISDESWNPAGYTFKTTENTDPTKELVTQVFTYSSGLIHYYAENSSYFYIDYYDYNLNLLWEKEISTSSLSEYSSLFNINNSLFFISFDNTSDKLYINKFKNVSISLDEKTYNLGIEAADRKVLFMLNNSSNHSISLAVYSKFLNKTEFYSIDESCNLIQTGEVEGLFNQVPVISLESGKVITQSGNTLCCYNSNWEQTNTKILETSYSGLCKIGDNLFMLFENMPEGLKVSYIDSNLNEVTFE